MGSVPESWADEPIPEIEPINTFLPPFANAANRKLDEEIKAIQRELQTIHLQLADNEDREVVMADHLANVQTELRYAQTRLASRKAEIDGEEHLRRLAAREEARCQKDLEQQVRQQEELTQQATSLQQTVNGDAERLQQFQSVMNWNEEELQRWADIAVEKEEDRLALAQYQRQDEAKVKDLNAKLDRLVEDVAAQRAKLDKELMETRAVQAQLEATADEFKAQHRQRRALAEQWDAATASIRRRDEAIMSVSERYAESKARLRTQAAELEEQEQMLVRQQALMKQVEQQLAALDRELGKTRMAQASEQATVNEAVDDLDNLKSTLVAAKRTLKQQEASCAAAREEVARYATRLEGLQERQNQATEQLTTETGQLGTLEARADQLEALRKEEDRRLAQTQSAVAELSKRHARARTQLSSRQLRARELQNEISSAQALRRNTVLGLRRMDELVARQLEMVYAKDFALIMLERKLARQMGQRTEDELAELNVRIQELTAALDTTLKELAMLQGQVRQAEDNLGRARRLSNQQQGEREQMEEGIKRLHMESETSQRCLAALTKEKEEKLVQRDSLSLDLTRLRGALDERTREVVGLQARNDALRSSLACRRQDIQASMEVLQAELKLVREDLHRVACELKTRAQRVASLRAKHDTILAKHGANAEEEEKSQAYKLISGAQRRSELQQKTAAVEAKIVVADREMQGLHAALVRLNGSNQGLIQSFKPTAMSAEQFALKEAREAAMRELAEWQEQETLLAKAIVREEGSLEELLAQQAQLSQGVQDLERQQGALSAQLAAQNDRHSRAVTAAERRRKALHTCRPEDAVLLEKDAELSTSQDTNSALLMELSELAAQQPDKGIPEQVQALGLKLPAPKHSQARRASHNSRRTSQPRGSKDAAPAGPAALPRSDSTESFSSCVSASSRASSRPASTASRASRTGSVLSMPMQTLQINV